MIVTYGNLFADGIAAENTVFDEAAHENAHKDTDNFLSL
jgi:hypothetical protein